MERIILHSDMNNFYASVECMLNPSLRDKFVAVCGREDERHGIILAKNEKAKAMGVSTGEPIWMAKQKCPFLITVQPNFELYYEYSQKAKEIYYRYTDLIEPFGLDECWLDVTGSTLLFGNGNEIANKIREEIKSELGLTVSIGVSFNKIFAKLGSDMKKPDAVTSIHKQDFKKTIWNLPASKLLGVGRVTTSKLLRKGIKTIGDLANTRPELLKKWIGINGVKLWQYANGMDYSRVAKVEYIMPIKSIGHGMTCVEDLGSDSEVWKVMLALIGDVARKLRKNKLLASGISVSVKGTNLKSRDFQCKLKKPTHNGKELADAAFELFKDKYDWSLQVRAISIRGIDLVSNDIPIQVGLFDNVNRELKRENIEQTMENIRDMYGKSSITYARLLEDNKLPNPANINMVMPGKLYV